MRVSPQEEATALSKWASTFDIFAFERRKNHGM
jgi:hypothetical protein